MRIFTTEQQIQYDEIFTTYREVIKPLLAQVEVRYQKFPIQIFNEIRALFDHLARAEDLELPEKDIDHELRRANSHIKRTILDCYKFLSVSSYETLKQFEWQTRNIDLGAVKDGRFKVLYEIERKKARKAIKFARIYDFETRTGKLFYKSKCYVLDLITIAYYSCLYYCCKYFSNEKLDNNYENFYLEYYNLRDYADKKLLEAKKLESKTNNQELAFMAYQEAHNHFVKIEDLIHENKAGIHHARTKFRIKSVLGIILSAISAVVIEKCVEKYLDFDILKWISGITGISFFNNSNFLESEFIQGVNYLIYLIFPFIGLSNKNAQ